MAQSVLSDERLEGLATSQSHLVASFLESHTKGHEGLDVAPATYGKDRDVHRKAGLETASFKERRKTRRLTTSLYLKIRAIIWV